MAIFQIGSTNIIAGAERHGASKDPPDRVTGISVQMVDTDGLWGSIIDPVARAAAGLPVGTVTRWGIQASAADGTYTNTSADWNNQGSVFQDALPFGSRDKSGGMPSLLIRSFDGNGNPLPVAQPGIKLRLAIQVNTTIKLGAEIRTNTDVA